MSNYQSSEIKLINTSLIDPHPDNPRKNIGDVTDLANSIKTNGLLSPLSVVPNGKRYRVIAGHRRLQACKQAGTGAVPCFVLDLDPLQQLEAMVTENCQREQLTVLEEADAIQDMLDLGATTADVAYRLGRSADYVRDRRSAASIPAAGTPEETIEELRKQNPDAVSVHEATQTIYLWDRRDAAAEAEKEAQRAAEQAERDARQHVLEEYAATTADKRMAWLHGHLHAIKRAKLIETTARLGLLQTIDPDPTGFTKDLHTWDDAACAREQFAAIAGIKPEQALAELHTHLDSPDWPTYAVMILTARIEWFISPNDWDWSGNDNVSRRIPGYYLILQDLGYEPSDDETEHLDQLVAAITEEDEEEDE